MTKLRGQAGQVQGEGLLSQVDRGWAWQRRRAASPEELRRKQGVGGGVEGGVWKVSSLWGLVGDGGGVWKVSGAWVVGGEGIVMKVLSMMNCRSSDYDFSCRVL